MRKTKYQGPRVASRERGRKTETGGLGKMQSSSMHRIMLLYEEVRRLGDGQDAAGGQDWVVRRGAADVTHAN